jgi:diguanylate cyclase (GGDEF)-like protein
VKNFTFISARLVKRVILIVGLVAIIAASSIFTYAAISHDNDNTVKKAFASRSAAVKEELNQKTRANENLVSTLGAFFNASDNVGQAEFTQFVKGLGDTNSHPSIKALAYAQRTFGSDQQQLMNEAADADITFGVAPSSSEGEHAILMYSNPQNAQGPIGLDAYSVPGGRESLEKADTTGKVISSTPMQYVVDGKKTTGYVLALAVHGGAALATASHADSANTGWVLAFVDPQAAYANMASLKDLNISITDTQSSKSVISVTKDKHTKFKSTLTFTIGERTRKATITPTSKFINSSYDRGRAARYAFLIANLEIIAVLLGIVFFMHKTRRRRETNLTFQAAHDILTGLPNRFFLEKWLEERGGSAVRRQQKVAVLFIDLDGFKAINDTLGHQMGDEFLIAISQRLQKEVRGRDVLARLGGDEFIVVLDEVSDEMQATRIAQRLIEVVRFPVMLDSGPVCVGASIGIAITQLDANSDSSSVIRFADAAMYAAKEDKEERIRVFDHKLKSIVDGRHEVESSIRGASSRSEIVDVLQPLVNIETGKTFGYEALCRWSHPIFGILSPDQFLDAAKVTGEIIEIDRWMANKAFKNAIEISQHAGQDTRVWINLSVRHLLQGEFYQHVMRALRDSEATADMLGVEVEEEVFKIDNGLLYPFLNQLRDLGIAISLDDFGSEDASLQALKRYPYDVIKLDRSMINEYVANPAVSIVPAVVELARSKGMTVVATGVESPDVLQMVMDVGCQVVQGYVFSEARPLADLVDQQPGFTWQLPLGVNRSIKRTHTDAEAVNTESSNAKEA